MIYIQIAFIQTLLALLGSMFFSNVLMYTPCVLCWYQRICMFPLVILFFVAILKEEKNVWQYTVPLAVIGWSIALYHNLLYYKMIPDTLAPCATGVSCTSKYIEYFGFITIPLLAFTAFSVVLLCAFLQYKTSHVSQAKHHQK
jgi:disulfide bond formation protein DsbB